MEGTAPRNWGEGRPASPRSAEHLLYAGSGLEPHCVEHAAIGTSAEHPEPEVGAEVRGPCPFVFGPRSGEIELVESTPHAIGQASIDHEMTRTKFSIVLVHGELETEIPTVPAQSEVGGDHLAVDFEEVEREIFESIGILGDLVIERPGVLVAGNGGPPVALPACLLQVVKERHEMRIGRFNSQEAQGAPRTQSSDPLAHAGAKVGAAVRTPRLLLAREAGKRDIWTAFRFPPSGERPVESGRLTQTLQGTRLGHITELEDVPAREALEEIPDRQHRRLSLDAGSLDGVETTRVAVGRRPQPGHWKATPESSFPDQG